MNPVISKQTSKIIEKNNAMRNTIYETASNIELLFKEYYDSLNPKKSSNNICFNSSLLDDLPFQQQIDIYKNSINEIRKESPGTKSNRIEIENLQKRIDKLKSNLYNQKLVRKNLDKVNQNFKKAFTNIKQDISSINQKEKENELKMLQNEFREIKNDYKESQLIIKKQVNSIIILEDNCKFIRENIEYAKYLRNQNEEENTNNDENYEINNVQKQADDIENDNKLLEKKYLFKIKKQKEIMNNIIKKNEYIEKKILEYNKEQIKESINSGINKNMNYIAKKKLDDNFYEIVEKNNYKHDKKNMKNYTFGKDDASNSVDEKNKLIKKTAQELNIMK